MKFTTFGIWDNEIKKLIAEIATPETIEALQEWFYSEGVLEFQKPQEIDYHQIIKATSDKYKHNPIYHGFMMRGQVDDGLKGLGKAVQRKLTELKIFDEKKLDIFYLFRVKGLDNHESFINLQAEITTEFNEWVNLPQNKDKTRRQHGEYVCGRFLLALATKPYLTEEVKEHVKLIREFLSQLPPDPKPVALPKENGLFKRVIEVSKTYLPTKCTIS